MYRAKDSKKDHKKNKFRFESVLTGSDEVPPVTSKASGRFEAVIQREGLDYRLAVKNISQVNQAHIHLGRPGTNGPIVVYLFRTDTPTGEINGRLSRGLITAKDLVGPLQGQQLFRLYYEMIRGNAYVNVHTVPHPNGEMRGQVNNLDDIFGNY